MIEAKGFRIFGVSEILGIRLRNQGGGDLGRRIQGSGLPIVSIVVPFFGLTKYIIRIL